MELPTSKRSLWIWILGVFGTKHHLRGKNGSSRAQPKSTKGFSW